MRNYTYPYTKTFHKFTVNSIILRLGVHEINEKAISKGNGIYLGSWLWKKWVAGLQHHLWLRHVEDTCHAFRGEGEGGEDILAHPQTTRKT